MTEKFPLSIQYPLSIRYQAKAFYERKNCLSSFVSSFCMIHGKKIPTELTLQVISLVHDAVAISSHGLCRGTGCSLFHCLELK